MKSMITLIGSIRWLTRLLAFVRHEPNCDALGVMWHQGPCDCGLHALVEKLPDEVKLLLQRSKASDRGVVVNVPESPES